MAYFFFELAVIACNERMVFFIFYFAIVVVQSYGHSINFLYTGIVYINNFDVMQGWPAFFLFDLLCIWIILELWPLVGQAYIAHGDEVYFVLVECKIKVHDITTRILHSVS